jgi:lipopolysaccharide transport system ATP-binding protein
MRESMKQAIEVEGLSKQYAIGVRQDGNYQTIRETITRAMGAPWERFRRYAEARFTGSHDRRATCGDSELSVRHFWALDRVSFEAHPGEVIGLVGRNGAGKSTLLKILSRITQPTHGRAILYGRLGSLLEVGTGFHPELSGRENIFLNGAVLGMSHREILRRFDEIVDFAEIGQFLDTPIKRYSSGMYVRLAFAVASCLDPEILVVDEVLAVGDAAFQKKCLGKMDEVSRSGRTILFVSHNMAAVKSLCTRAIFLDQGRIVADGNVDEIVNLYFESHPMMTTAGSIPDDAPRQSNGEARFRSVHLMNPSGKEVTQLYFGQPFRVTCTCDVLADIPDGHFEVSISTFDGVHITYSTTLDGGRESSEIPPGRYEICADFREIVLLPGRYVIDLGIHHDNGTTSDFIQRALEFSILRVSESGDDHYRWNRTRGLVRTNACWRLQRVPS